MEIISNLIDYDKTDYKCYDILKKLINSNDKFKNLIVQGYLQGYIYPFDEELWSLIRKQNIRNIDNFETVFKDGANLGYCTVASKQLSYSLNNCYLCGGVVPILKGTQNCEDGSHTWILHNGKIIDTTLMLIIDNEYAKELGYIEENRYDPTTDPVYNACKQFTLDSNLKK